MKPIHFSQRRSYTRFPQMEKVRSEDTTYSSPVQISKITPTPERYRKRRYALQFDIQRLHSGNRRDVKHQLVCIG